MSLHPSVRLRKALESANLGITDAAKSLGVSRQLLHQVLTGRARVSARLAVGIERHFSVPAEVILLDQLQCELVELRANVEQANPTVM